MTDQPASLRRRQVRREAAKREQIAQVARERADGQTPHLDGACSECREGEAHVAYVNEIGRVVYIPTRRRPWWRRLFADD